MKRGSDTLDNDEVVGANGFPTDSQVVGNGSSECNNQLVGSNSSQAESHMVGAGSSQSQDSSQKRKRVRPPKIKITTEKRFENNFEKFPKRIGRGGFGYVYKAKQKSSQEWFAIKEIELAKLKALNMSKERITLVLQREVNTLSKSKSDFVVHFFHSWNEDNKMFYIKMELCSTDLNKIIDEKRKCFERTANKEMSSVIEYFISCQLFKEIVECVQYLHGLRPAILHRDVKEENVLVNFQPLNGRFVKIGDFGLAKMGGKRIKTHTADQGTIGRMGQEVRQGRYSPESDLFGLSVIGQLLFDINIHNRTITTNNKDLKTRRKAVFDLLKEMTIYPNFWERPNCCQVLERFNEWGINANELTKLNIKPEDVQDLSLTRILDNITDSEDTFFFDYYDLKSQYNWDSNPFNNNVTKTNKKTDKKGKKKTIKKIKTNSNVKLESNQKKITQYFSPSKKN